MCVKDLSYKVLNSDLKILMKTPSYFKLWVVDHVLLNLSNKIFIGIRYNVYEKNST